MNVTALAALFLLRLAMYPQAESKGERIDSLDPETFKYSITARELTS